MAEMLLTFIAGFVAGIGATLWTVAKVRTIVDEWGEERPKPRRSRVATHEATV